MNLKPSGAVSIGLKLVENLAFPPRINGIPVNIAPAPPVTATKPEAILLYFNLVLS